MKRRNDCNWKRLGSTIGQEKLRNIGFRDVKNIEEEKFFLKEFRNYFKAESENRFERRIEELMITANECTVRDDPLSRC